MTVIRRVLFAVLLGMLISCSESPPEQKVEAVPTPEVVAAQGEVVEIPLQEITIEKKVTSEDIREIILAGLGDKISKRAKIQTIDTSIQLLRLADDEGIDPIMLTNEYMELLNTTLDIQPVFRRGWDGGVGRAMWITLDFYTGAREVQKMSCHDLDPNFPEDLGSKRVPKVNPYMVLAVAYRESRLAKRIELGHKLGGQNERGMFQFKPRPNGRGGFIESKFMPRFKAGTTLKCSPFDRSCAARGAARALAWIRCKGIERFGEKTTIAVYMAGYGMNRLPTPEEARHHRGPVNARKYLCSVMDDCDSVWPVSHSDDFALSL